MSVKAVFREDSSCHVVGRLTMADGTGAATGIAGEGNFAKLADLSSIVRTVYDQSNGDVVVIGPTTLTLANVVFDTVITDTALWAGNAAGYNFKDQITNAAFPTGGNIYRIEYRITPAAGAAHAWTEAVIGLAESFAG